MSKVFGKTERYTLVDTSGNRTLVNYGIESVDEINSTWYEISFSKAHSELPNINDVKKAIIEDINTETDLKILSGFVWNGKPVWLSAENQRNFSEGERKAKENPSRLPMTYKIGQDSDGNPVYHTFTTVEEIEDFYDSCFDYIQKCLTEGWKTKDNFDWSPYEDLLPNPDLPIIDNE